MENIHRHIYQKFHPNFYRLILLATQEIGPSTIIATLTIILALLSMQFVSGMIGAFMKPISLNAPLAMFISLLVAYSVVPFLSYHFLRKNIKTHIESLSQRQHYTYLGKVYEKIFFPLVSSNSLRILFYCTILILFLITLFQPFWQFIKSEGVNTPLSYFGNDVKIIPDDNTDSFLIQIDAGEGKTMHKTDKIIQDLEPILLKSPYVKHYQIYFGEAAPVDFSAMVRGDYMLRGTHLAQVRIKLNNTSMFSHEIIQKIYRDTVPLFSKYPKAKIKFYETPSGPPVKSQMEGGIYGPNYEIQESIAKQISKNIYPKVEGMINIDHSVDDNVKEYRIKIDRPKALQAGLEPAMIADEIFNLYNGTIVGSIHTPEDREPKSIQLELPKEQKNNIEAIQNLMILNKQGVLTSLKNIISLKKIFSPSPIYTRDQHPITYVSGEILFGSPVFGAVAISQMLGKEQFQNNIKVSVENAGIFESEPHDLSHYQFFWFGETRISLDIYRDLGISFLIALILIYLLLTAFYSSFLLPVITMFTIPLTVIGVFPGHWLLNKPVTATSIIGFVVLSGIVVRNALHLIDFIIEHRGYKETIEEVLAHAGESKFLAILLPTLVTILSSLIMLPDPVFNGLAITLIFGSISSSLLTIIVIPLIYYDCVKIRDYFKHRS